MFDSQAVLAAVSPAEAIERTRAAFERHASGDWVMPAKVYVDAPPDGDFRAMPARGDGLATLKWVTSFPANPARGLPVVTGALLVSSARTGELLAIMDCAAITSLRTGAAAAVSALALAREDARTVGRDRLRRQRRLGGPLPGGRRLRAGRVLRPAAGGGAGARGRARLERRRRARRRRPPTSSSTVTPADEPVIAAADLRAGQHLAVLGADAHGKAEVELDALRAAAACSATSGSRRRRAASSPARSSAGTVGRERRDRDRGRPARSRAGPPRRRRGHPVRLDRARHPGPRDRARGARGAPRGPGRGRDGRALGRAPAAASSRAIASARSAAQATVL